MSNKTVGTIFLLASSLCCTLGMVGAKLAYALERGMLNLAKGGASPQRSELGWETARAVIALSALGVFFLFRADEKD